VGHGVVVRGGNSLRIDEWNTHTDVEVYLAQVKLYRRKASPFPDKIHARLAPKELVALGIYLVSRTCLMVQMTWSRVYLQPPFSNEI
jgi:hypothetical protein